MSPLGSASRTARAARGFGRIDSVGFMQCFECARLVPRRLARRMVLIVKLPARRPQKDAGKEPRIQDDSTEISGEHALPDDVSQEKTSAKPKTPELLPSPVRVPSTPENKTPELVPVTSNLDVLLAPSVLKHRYVRGVDKSNIVERPQRIRAVLLGIAGVYGVSEKLSVSSRTHPEHLATMLSNMTIEERESPVRMFKTSRILHMDDPEASLSDIHAYASEPAMYSTQTEFLPKPDEGPLPSSHLARMSILASKAPHDPPGSLPRSPNADADLSDATSSDGEGDERMHPSEIPEMLPQGDLYLCGPHAQGVSDMSDGGSREAICHALGACVEAVDRVVTAAKKNPSVLISEQILPTKAGMPDIPPTQATAHIPAKRAFVLSRPPGHHCCGAEPSGFCWVNNVMVAAAHAYRSHSIDRVVILDIDLHHGNGTQALVWRRNSDAAVSDAQRQAKLQTTLRNMQRSGTGSSRQAARTAEAARTPWEKMLYEESLVGPRAQRVFYGSLHDIESFPCENEDADLIRNASVCMAGAHGQWIWNGTYPGYMCAMILLYKAVRLVKGLKELNRHLVTTCNRYLSPAHHIHEQTNVSAP